MLYVISISNKLTFTEKVMCVSINVQSKLILEFYKSFLLLASLSKSKLMFWPCSPTDHGFEDPETFMQ